MAYRTDSPIAEGTLKHSRRQRFIARDRRVLQRTLLRQRAIDHGWRSPNPYGEAIMRPTRIGTSRSALPWWLAMICWIGSGRLEGGSQSASERLGTRLRRLLPSAQRSARAAGPAATTGRRQRRSQRVRCARWPAAPSRTRPSGRSGRRWRSIRRRPTAGCRSRMWMHPMPGTGSRRRSRAAWPSASTRSCPRRRRTSRDRT